MSVVMIAFIFSLGAGAWIYNQMMRQTGNNTQSSLTTAGISGAAIFLFLWLILAWFL